MEMEKNETLFYTQYECIIINVTYLCNKRLQVAHSQTPLSKVKIKKYNVSRRSW